MTDIFYAIICSCSLAVLQNQNFDLIFQGKILVLIMKIDNISECFCVPSTKSPFI